LGKFELLPLGLLTTAVETSLRERFIVGVLALLLASGLGRLLPEPQLIAFFLRSVPPLLTYF